MCKKKKRQWQKRSITLKYWVMETGHCMHEYNCNGKDWRNNSANRHEMPFSPAPLPYTSTLISTYPLPESNSLLNEGTDLVLPKTSEYAQRKYSRYNLNFFYRQKIRCLRSLQWLVGTLIMPLVTCRPHDNIQDTSEPPGLESDLICLHLSISNLFFPMSS